MAAASSYGELRQLADPVWRAVFDHPFVTGIQQGTLTDDRYGFYLRQDYLYVLEFSRVLALTVAKAERLEDARTFTASLQNGITSELEMLRKSLQDLGQSTEGIEDEQPAFVTTAFVDYLVRTCYEGRIPDILAMFLATVNGYIETGRTLKERGLPKQPVYRRWILTFASDEFKQFADWIAARFDEHAAAGTEEDRERWQRIYLTASRYELLFFDQCWRMEAWPEVVPS